MNMSGQPLGVGNFMGQRRMGGIGGPGMQMQINNPQGGAPTMQNAQLPPEEAQAGPGDFGGLLGMLGKAGGGADNPLTTSLVGDTTATPIDMPYGQGELAYGGAGSVMPGVVPNFMQAPALPGATGGVQGAAQATAQALMPGMTPDMAKGLLNMPWL